MNEIDLVAGLRPAVPLPDSDDLAAARSRVTAVLAAEPGSARERWRPKPATAAGPGRRAAGARRRRALTLGAVAAAGVAVACGLTFLVSAGSVPAASVSAGHGADPVASVSAGHGADPAVGRHPAVSVPATLTAVQFLTQAAGATRHEQAAVPAPDQYIYSDLYDGQEPARTWLPADGLRPGVFEYGSRGYQSEGPCSAAQAASTGCTLAAGYLPEFPVRASAVLAYLAKLRIAETSVPSAQDPPNWLANDTGKAVASLLQTTYMLPAQLSAVFQMLAQTPGFEIVRNAVDALGRHGVGIYWLYQGAGAMIVFNPVTYQFLGFGTWPDGAVPADGQIPPASGGVVSAPNAVALTAMAIVNSEPRACPSPINPACSQ
jgi:hypothetical protein